MVWIWVWVILKNKEIIVDAGRKVVVKFEIAVSYMLKAPAFHAKV